MLSLRKAKTIFVTLAAFSALVLAPGCAAPGGGFSSSSSYSCDEPDTPKLEQLIPDKVTHGQPDLLLIINGSHFSKRSLAFAGDKTQIILRTTFITDKQLTALLPAQQMATSGLVAISVSSPGVCDDGSASGVIKNSTYLYVEVQ